MINQNIGDPIQQSRLDFLGPNSDSWKMTIVDPSNHLSISRIYNKKTQHIVNVYVRMTLTQYLCWVEYELVKIVKLDDRTRSWVWDS